MELAQPYGLKFGDSILNVKWNPVDASLCRDASEWRWSSTSAHLADEDDESSVDPEILESARADD